MATAPPQDQLNISRMLELPAQSFLNKDWSFVHTYQAFMHTHTHLLFKEKDSPMSEYSGMLGTVSGQRFCPGSRHVFLQDRRK